MASSGLVAGDVVSLTSAGGGGSSPGAAAGTGTGTGRGGRRGGGGGAGGAGGLHVPCDLALLRGSAVTNEAVLTGESVPQIKEGVDALIASGGGGGGEGGGDDVPRLDIDDPSHKRSVIFGGTLLVNHSAPEDGGRGDAGVGGGSIPPPPDGGVVALVLRTGFDTVQGSLLRTMVHSSVSGQNDGANTLDTFVFVSILLLCALGSSALVLREGWSDPTRNRFKLILHVIIIITSVVPPELPMELSLAVTNSIADLVSRCKVYCMEPWRIPIAGKVTVCCFDKTGTLTSDEMILRGVRLPSKETSSIGCGDGTVGGSDLDLELPFVDGEEDEEGTSGEPRIPAETLRVMVACHALALHPQASSGVIGDPLEKAVFEGCGWRFSKRDVVSPPLPHGAGLSQLKAQAPSGLLEICHRYAFTSKLRRMSTMVCNHDLGAKNTTDDVWLLTKGAPETVKGLLSSKSTPKNYSEVARYHMGRGQRVLALAYRVLGTRANVERLKSLDRTVVEQNLIFAGFLVLDCPLKPDTRRIVRELRESGHQVKMITGDAILTATEVAKQCDIIGTGKKKKKGTKDKIKLYELNEINRGKSDASDKTGVKSLPEFSFVPLGNDASKIEDTIAFEASNFDVVRDMVMANEIAVSVTGDILAQIAMNAVRSSTSGHDDYIDPKTVLLHPAAQMVLQKLVPLVSIFARHAPRHKEAVIAALNRSGAITLMCGDGTNDVGALKMAHIGVSIISVPDLEAKQRKALKGVEKIKEKEKKYRKAGTTKKSKARKQNLNDSLRAFSQAEEELQFVKLGDASVASPFTSKTMSIRCTKDILQRGRCTLVTMLQIYKVLGVNSLVNALMLTRLHMVGVKQGDRQLTIVGLVVAALFYFITRGQPLSTLSRKRPPSSILCTQALLSITVQFAVHFAFIMGVTSLSAFYLDPDDPSLVPDGHFNPNILNTTTFLISVLATVNTFVVNYQGRPYMQNFSENKMMLRSVQICYGVLFACALEVFPPLNQLMQLTPLPEDGAEIPRMSTGAVGDAEGFVEGLASTLVPEIGFKLTLCLLMGADTVLVYVAEKTLQALF